MLTVVTRAAYFGHIIECPPWQLNDTASFIFIIYCLQLYIVLVMEHSFASEHFQMKYPDNYRFHFLTLLD